MTMLAELGDDWLVKPFVSVRVTDQPCADGEDQVFVREWGGTEEGCSYFRLNGYSRLLGGKDVIGTRKEYDDYVEDLYIYGDYSSRGWVQRRFPCEGIAA